jgi:hypothetical protein
VLLGAPLAIVGVLAVLGGHVSPSHRALIDHATEVGANGFSFTDMGAFYPPAPIIATLLVGASAVGMAVISSLFAGSALHSAWEGMVQRGVPHATQLMMLCSVTLVPSVWFLASQDIPTIGGITMLVIALAGFIRFVFSNDTIGGFTAGLFMAAAFFFDPAALAYAFTLALATPFLASTRYSREPGATRALISVLLFPTLAALAGWVFIEWRFTGSPFSFISSDLGLFQFDVTAISALASAASSVLVDVLKTPVYLVVAILLARQRPVAGLGLLAPIVGLILVRWSGLSYSPTATLILLSLLAIVSVPTSSGRLTRWLLLGAAITQLGLNIVFPPLAPGFAAWWATL